MDVGRFTARLVVIAPRFHRHLQLSWEPPPLVKLLLGPDSFMTSVEVVVVVVGRLECPRGCRRRCCRLGGPSLGPSVPSCAIIPAMQYLKLQCVALQESSMSKQQGQILDVVGACRCGLWSILIRADSGKSILRNFWGTSSMRPQKILDFLQLPTPLPASDSTSRILIQLELRKYSWNPCPHQDTSEHPWTRK